VSTKLIDDYIAKLPEARAERGRLLHALVLKLFPDAVVSLDYRMPTYRMGEHFFAWASQKQYLSVYTCSSERITAFKKRRPEVKSGVGCLNFRDKDAFVAAELRAVVNDALKPSRALLERERAALARAKLK
jgi:hypothetical protein